MANHTSLQNMDEELKKFLKRLYPTKSMPKATHQLAEDLWDDLIFGKRIKTKYKDKFKS
uniref:Uncharacterized protein n=1 Tax=viral metagenome TaxID=1070528 RepID=A0A6H1ZHM2_9ZZZZ